MASNKTPQPFPAILITLPDAAEALDIPVTRVRRLIEDRHLLGTKVEGVLRVPQDFIKDGRVLSELHGTFVLLHDVGFSDDEILDWMFSVEESLGVTPMAALQSGRKAEVRRIAQALL